MSKLLAIVFCAVFASAAHAKWSLTMTAEMQAFNKTLDATTSKLLEKMDVTREQLKQIVGNSSDASSKFIRDTRNEMSLTKQKIRAEISKLVDNAKDLDINDCLQYVDHLDSTTKPVILNMMECYAAKHTTGRDKIVDITKLFIVEFARLKKLREDAGRCTESLGDDPMSGFEALLCIRGVGLNVTESGNFGNDLTNKIVTLNTFFESFESLLASCRNTNEFVNFLAEAATVVEKTDKCIQEKRTH